MVATIPLILDRPKVDWGPYSAGPGARSEFEIGQRLISANGERSFWYFTLARWACLPFSLLGGYVCWRWARELYGQLSGLLALILWCFCPNILGHAQLITPDVGETALGLTPCTYFWPWFKDPRWHLALVAGIADRLAAPTKTH